MFWFHVALYAHILGIVALTFALFSESSTVLTLRRAQRSDAALREAVLRLDRNELYKMVSGVVLLASGGYMTYRISAVPGWLIVSLVVFFIMAAQGGPALAYVKKSLARIDDRPPGVRTAQYRALAGWWYLPTGAFVGLGAMAALVALMIFTPGAGASVVVAAVCMAVGACCAAALPRLERREHAAAAAQGGAAEAALPSD